jgi:serine/threonine-protein kinase
MPEQLNCGDSFGQYDIVRLLGRGGMGEVYEARHRVLERVYALKLLPLGFQNNSGASERFQREATHPVHFLGGHDIPVLILSRP